MADSFLAPTFSRTVFQSWDFGASFYNYINSVQTTGGLYLTTGGLYQTTGGLSGQQVGCPDNRWVVSDESSTIDIGHSGDLREPTSRTSLKYFRGNCEIVFCENVKFGSQANGTF